MQTELDYYEISMSKNVRDHEYKKALKREHTNIQRDLIRNILVSHPEGITDREISVLTGISRSSVNARRNELGDVVVVGIATRVDDDGVCITNTLWGIENYLNEPPHPLISCGTQKR